MSKQIVSLEEAMQLHKDPYFIVNQNYAGQLAEPIGKAHDTTYFPTTPFAKYWWVSDDPQDTTYIPMERRV